MIILRAITATFNLAMPHAKLLEQQTIQKEKANNQNIAKMTGSFSNGLGDLNPHIRNSTNTINGKF